MPLICLNVAPAGNYIHRVTISYPDLAVVEIQRERTYVHINRLGARRPFNYFKIGLFLTDIHNIARTKKKKWFKQNIYMYIECEECKKHKVYNHAAFRSKSNVCY